MGSQLWDVLFGASTLVIIYNIYILWHLTTTAFRTKHLDTLIVHKTSAQVLCNDSTVELTPIYKVLLQHTLFAVMGLVLMCVSIMEPLQVLRLVIVVGDFSYNVISSVLQLVLKIRSFIRTKLGYTAPYVPNTFRTTLSSPESVTISLNRGHPGGDPQTY